MKQIPLLLLVLIFFASTINAQISLEGTVVDEKDQALIGAEVYIDAATGTITDENGNFDLLLDEGKYTLQVSYMGYETYTAEVTLTGNENQALTIILKESSTSLDIVTVTGSRYEKNIVEEAVSIEVITPEFIERNNNTSLADVIERIPGVQMLDGQVNIRSGSGYAYGAGSRVAVVVDDQPLLSAELADVKWNFIPIENAAQIEVIKGAASVLYGSGGLNGVINVRTAFPTTEPYTKFSIYQGYYAISNKNNRRWYRDFVEQPGISGVYFSHREKINPNFDLVLGSNVHIEESYNKDADEQRYRFNANTRFRTPKNENLTYGVNVNFMYHKKGDFFIWHDARDSIFHHISNPGNIKYYTFTVDPYLTTFDQAGNKHSVKMRYFSVLKFLSAGVSPTGLTSGEYQFQRRSIDNSSTITAGVNLQHFFARSNLFEKTPIFTETDTLVGWATASGFVGAIYAQVDKKIADRLNLTGGVRLETFQINNETSVTLPIFRGGANFALSERDYLRASFGQGYRVPSLAERYIDDQVTDGVNVLPNPNLGTERGYSTEIGYKRVIDKSSFKGFVDVAAFLMEYRDMTEFYFDMHITDPLNFSFDSLGFKAINVSQARIAGVEASIFGEGKLGSHPYRIWAGYTYTYPGDLENDPSQKNIGTYLGNFFSAFSLSPDDPLVNSILKYRSIHVGRLDVECDIKQFTLGAACNYNGYIYRVDEVFETSSQWYPLINQVIDIDGIEAFRKEHLAGDLILDIRGTYRHNSHRFDLIVNNLLNREYALRPGRMNPPLAINMRYHYTF